MAHAAGARSKSPGAHAGGAAAASRGALLLLCTAGIYAAYVTQGVVSEHLSMRRYGPRGERFPHLDALTGAQSAMCFLWAWALFAAGSAAGWLNAKGLPPWHAYWKAGFTNALGPACGMAALRNISYPAQVLAKSCKMVPVMLVGTLLYGARYSPLEYLCMMMIGAGVAIFAGATAPAVTAKLAAPNGTLGYGLVAVNLLLDGYTNSSQDDVNRRHASNSPLHMMAWMNFWTSLYHGLYLFGFTAAGPGVVAFCIANPDAARDLAMFCACGAIGQLFVFAAIKLFSSLVATLVCTTRKFFSILASVLFNGNPLLPQQWWAAGLVFAGLIGATLVKRGSGGAKRKTA